MEGWRSRNWWALKIQSSVRSELNGDNCTGAPTVCRHLTVLPSPLALCLRSRILCCIALEGSHRGTETQRFSCASVPALEPLCKNESFRDAEGFWQINLVDACRSRSKLRALGQVEGDSSEANFLWPFRCQSIRQSVCR